MFVFTTLHFWLFVPPPPVCDRERRNVWISPDMKSAFAQKAEEMRFRVITRYTSAELVCWRGARRGHDTYVQGILSSLRLWSTVKADKPHWLGRQEDRTKEKEKHGLRQNTESAFLSEWHRHVVLFLLLFYFFYIMHEPPTPPSPSSPSFSLSLSLSVYKTVATERLRGERERSWTLTLYKESSSFGSPMPKYGQCESEKVHVRVSARGGSWKRRRDREREVLGMSI